MKKKAERVEVFLCEKSVLILIKFYDGILPVVIASKQSERGNPHPKISPKDSIVCWLLRL
ncbi:hypothetical protein [Helicobacter sp. MIT 05-5294]|uniref:hypothetical protein n=1 Tax=Helicobacter sp. MIT 05-5294 TaxID=1548150 RepID=UPI00051FBB34|nr:hypothetical protein [Helicobacter sp. MIT 05-5294]TLD85745.1 hypothetical protein LS69_008075 [Helicobacter sp. MIT 05-5294]